MARIPPNQFLGIPGCSDCHPSSIQHPLNAVRDLGKPKGHDGRMVESFWRHGRAQRVHLNASLTKASVFVV
jgi:hypothetical protein